MFNVDPPVYRTGTSVNNHLWLFADLRDAISDAESAPSDQRATLRAVPKASFRTLPAPEPKGAHLFAPVYLHWPEDIETGWTQREYCILFQPVGEGHQLFYATSRCTAENAHPHCKDNRISLAVRNSNSTMHWYRHPFTAGAAVERAHYESPSQLRDSPAVEDGPTWVVVHAGRQVAWKDVKHIAISHHDSLHYPHHLILIRRSRLGVAHLPPLTCCDKASYFVFRNLTGNTVTEHVALWSSADTSEAAGARHIVESSISVRSAATHVSVPCR